MSATIATPPQMSVNLVASGPGNSPIKQACATFQAHGGQDSSGNAQKVQLTVTATEFGTTKSTSSDAAASPTVELCVETGFGSTTVDFTATATDQGQFHRADFVTTAQATSAEGNVDPVGALVSATGGTSTVHVTGWAIDPDTTNPIDVHAYIGGPSSEGDAYSSGDAPGLLANKSCAGIATIPAQYLAYGSNHCYDATITIRDNAIYKTGTLMVYIYGLNNVYNTNHPGLGETTVTIT